MHLPLMHNTCINRQPRENLIVRTSTRMAAVESATAEFELATAELRQAIQLALPGSRQHQEMTGVLESLKGEMDALLQEHTQAQELEQETTATTARQQQQQQQQQQHQQQQQGSPTNSQASTSSSALTPGNATTAVSHFLVVPALVSAQCDDSFDLHC